MRRRLIIAAVSIGIVAGAGFGPGADVAYAACALPDVCSGSSVVTATLTGTLGTRSVATVAPIAINSVTNATSLGSTWDVTASEVGRSGTNPWSLGATLSGGQVTAGSDTIPASAFSLSGNTATVLLGGGGNWTAGAGGAMNNDGTTQTPLCSNANQISTTTYTGTYRCNGNVTLTIPNNTPNGVYTGTFVVTLNQ